MTSVSPVDHWVAHEHTGAIRHNPHFLLLTVIVTANSKKLKISKLKISWNIPVGLLQNKSLLTYKSVFWVRDDFKNCYPIITTTNQPNNF